MYLFRKTVFCSTNTSKKLQEKNYSLLQNKPEVFQIPCYGPTYKIATFKKFRLVFSKRGIYSKGQLSVLRISVKVYTKKITFCYKTILNIFLYNVIGLHESMRLSKYSNTI